MVLLLQTVDVHRASLWRYGVYRHIAILVNFARDSLFVSVNDASGGAFACP